jgi:hypothetical protein
MEVKRLVNLASLEVGICLVKVVDPEVVLDVLVEQVPGLMGESCC